MIQKETLNSKILFNIKDDLVNKAGIGRADFEKLKHRHIYIYIYMKSIGYAITEGNLRTHKCRFGIQPDNYKNRIKEIQWNELM